MYTMSFTFAFRTVNDSQTTTLSCLPALLTTRVVLPTFPSLLTRLPEDETIRESFIEDNTEREVE